MITLQTESTHLLKHADILRLLAVSFRYPTEEVKNNIRGTLQEMNDMDEFQEYHTLLNALQNGLNEDLTTEFSYLFIQGRVPINETACLASPGAIANVAADYAAFGLLPKNGEAPDALFYELEFLAILLHKAAIAETEEQKEITLLAFQNFLENHTAPFVQKFIDFFTESTNSQFYQALIETVSWEIVLLAS